MTFSVPGYRLRPGSGLDRALLVNFMHRTYAEIASVDDTAQLSEAVDRHFSRETPLWWVEPIAGHDGESAPIACLWLGNAVDQLRGLRHTCILLLYVAPSHRRQGIATALLQQAQRWAGQRGDFQIGLQVFANNAAAIALYKKMGYQTASLWMTRPLTPEANGSW